MINKNLAIKVLNAALATGGDFAEIYFSETNDRRVMVENGHVEGLATSVESGIGIRILKGLRSVYGHTNDMSQSNLLSLASDLSKSFEGKQELEVKELKLQSVKPFYKGARPYDEVSDEEIIKLLKETNDIAKGYDQRIVKAMTAFVIEAKDVVIFNSKGQIFKNHTEYGRFVIQTVAFENGKVETNFDGPGAQDGFDFFLNKIDCKEKARHNAEVVIKMLGAKECPSGKFPVVIGNGWGGVIFHEACGHQMEATSVAKGLSVYAPLYGKKIGNDIVTAYDDSTIPFEWGSVNMDDEGQRGEKRLLIENGVLKNYMVDPFGSRRMEGFRPNGCSRRQSYKFEPTSRMSNTYIAPGKSTKEEIIAATKKGIYAVSFHGGSVDPSTGEFQFGCCEAYLIKDGKICEPLRGATLIGKATDVLFHIDMVGNDLAFGQGMCGSSSGSIHTNVGQPTIRVDEIAVGGRGGSIDEL